MDWAEQLPDGAVVADAAGRVVFANDTAARLLGDQDLVGRSLAEAMTLQDNHGGSWFDVLTPYDGLPSRVGLPESAWLTRAGTEVLVTGRIHRDPQRAITSVALSIRSGRGRSHLDRDRSDLVATVAHELRSPLTGVKGFVQTLLDKWERLNDEQKKLLLTTVHSDAERLQRLITELLDAARIDTGRLPIYARSIDAHNYLKRAVESAREGTSREIRRRFDATDATAFADPDKFLQVITNLIENAIRHGEGLVEVSTRDDGAHLIIEVTDEGEGIPEQLRQRVFAKFWQGATRGGTGLGMYISGGLTRAMGGEIVIGDAPGGGARIETRWPRGSAAS